MLTGTFQYRRLISHLGKVSWTEEEAVSTYTRRNSPLTILYVAGFVYSGQP